MVQMKDRVSALLMETGVGHNKQRPHKVVSFRELLSANAGVHPSILPLLKLSRETIERLSSRVEKLYRCCDEHMNASMRSARKHGMHVSRTKHRKNAGLKTLLTLILLN